MTTELYPRLPVVLVDDELQILESFSRILASGGITNIQTFSDSREVIPYLSANKAAVVLLDIRMPHISGDVLLGRIREMLPDIAVIMITAYQDLDTVIECMKLKALDYLVKPVEINRLLSAVRNAVEMMSMRHEIASLREYLLGSRLKTPGAFRHIHTRSSGMYAIFEYLEAIRNSNQPVLITGETGVGKELMASAVHELSGRKGKFIAVNVAGLDDAMFTDTLFGHVKGAFTGADRARDGIISAAAGGTIFLDEVGDMTEASQVKLLRLLQDNIYFQLGSDLPRKSTARVVAATNRDVAAAASEGRFRKDLYYRLCTHHVHIPSLRERPDDIPLLLDIFVGDAAQSLNKKRPSCAPGLSALLSGYALPGNVRELQAMVLDAVARNQSGNLTEADFSAIAAEADALSVPALPELSCSFNRFPTLSEIEDYLVREALDRSGGNKTAAASLLGITRQGLHKKMEKLHPIPPESHQTDRCP